jgi:hypothetical protein
MVPFTVELTIEPGPVEPGGVRDGFGESNVIVSPIDKAPMSRAADLRWGSERLATGTTVATFLDTFWNGRSVSHPDALDFGRALSRRLLGHPALRERWREIRAWRGERPLRLELVLPPARTSAIGAVPFELLADEDGFWFYGGQSSLVRCIADLEPRPARIPTNARLQVAWANPLDIASRVDDSVFEDHGALLTRAGKEPGSTSRQPCRGSGSRSSRIRSRLADRSRSCRSSLTARRVAAASPWKRRAVCPVWCRRPRSLPRCEPPMRRSHCCGPATRPANTRTWARSPKDSCTRRAAICRPSSQRTARCGRAGPLAPPS